MRKIILSLALFFCCITLAQSAQIDLLYLTNGSVIRGAILSLVPNDSVKIQTADGSLFVYQMSEVLRIEKMEGSDDTSGANDTASSNQRFLRKGRSLIFELKGGGWVGTSSSGMVPAVGQIGISVMAGRRYNNYFAIHGGLSPSFWLSSDGKIFNLPLFVDLRGNLSPTAISPYWAFKIGPTFLIPIVNSTNPTISFVGYVSPTFGVKFGLPKADVLLGLSYEAIFDSEMAIHVMTVSLGFAY